jgi:glycine betaine catabolism B
MQTIDTYIQRITMYKLVAWCLGTVAGIAVLFGFVGVLHFSGWSLLYSVLLLVGVSWAANELFAKIYGAVTNSESSAISGFILFFLFSPPRSIGQAGMLAAIAVIAMASKYLIAYRGRHIFNPAAFGAAVGGFIGFQHASWWVATGAMLPLVLLAGLLVVRKIRRTPMFVIFYAIAFVLIVARGIIDGQPLPTLLTNTAVSYPLLFLGTIMLTEPLTAPPTRQLRTVYAVLVAVLVASNIRFAGIYMAPEIALLLGNIFAYTTTLRQRVSLRLLSREEIAPHIYEYAFQPLRPFAYTAGQYMEVTLPIPLRQTDIRGNRRTFTIASSPTEATIKMGIKFAEKGSRFKHELLALPLGGMLYGMQLAGDFVLPADANKKLVFMAGGIGITPFRSHLQWLIDSKQQRDIVVLYAVADPAQIVYKDVLAAAKDYGVRVVFVLANGVAPAGWQGEAGPLTTELISRIAPDYHDRLFYISGPPPMVTAQKQQLKTMGVRHIKTDYFSGY